MSSPLSNSSEAEWINLVRSQVEKTRFGVIQIVIHEGRVVQIERTEKVRLEKTESGSALSAYRTTGG
jgi:hypothetical protein